MSAEAERTYTAAIKVLPQDQLVRVGFVLVCRGHVHWRCDSTPRSKVIVCMYRQCRRRVVAAWLGGHVEECVMDNIDIEIDSRVAPKLVIKSPTLKVGMLD